MLTTPFRPLHHTTVLRAPEGTLGAGIVGPDELRDGAVGLAALADLPEGSVIGRPAGLGAGAASALSPQELRDLVATGATELALPTRLDLAAETIPLGVGFVRVQGHDAPGDGGASGWVRAASQPSHPGRTQSADGAWWELRERQVTPQMLGGTAADGATDEAQALRDTFACAIAIGSEIALTEDIAVHSDIDIADPFVLRGLRKNARIVLHQGATFRVRRGPAISDVTDRGVIEDVTFEDGADQSPWIDKPLLELGPAFAWRIQSCWFHGRNRRRYGAWFGRGGTIWGTSFFNNEFIDNQIGVVIGDVTDATHNHFAANTVHHNKICGAVFCNPHGGAIVSNSFEFNEGRVGLAILSGANGSSPVARALKVTGNYIFNNASAHSGDVESAGVLIGHDVPGTDFSSPGVDELTSSLPAWAIDLSNNYIVSTFTWRAVRANLANGSRVADNIVQRNAGSSHSIELTGQLSRVTVADNKDQNLPTFDAVTADASFREPVTALGGAVTTPGDLTATGVLATSSDRIAFRTSGGTVSDDRGGVAYLRELTGGAGSAGVVLDTASVTGADAFFVLVTVERTNETAKASHLLHLVKGVNGTVTPVSSAGTLQGDAFAVSGGVLRLTRSQAWQGNAVAVFAGTPFAT